MESFQPNTNPGNRDDENPPPTGEPIGASTGTRQGVTVESGQSTTPRRGGGITPLPPVTLQRTAPVPPTQRLVKPIMGDIVILPEGNEIAWVGGKPRIRWTGLDATSMPIPTPTMYRNVGSKDIKSFTYRTRGLEVKLSIKDDLRAVSRKIMAHLKQHGMDTISYVPDPAKPMVMESVVEKPNLFTKEYVVSQIPFYTGRYDEYDRLNDRTATDFLLASLDADLERKVTEALVTSPNPSFLLTWMTLVEKMRLLSVSRVTNCQKRVEERLPTDYSGQNLETMAEANLRDLIDLQQAGWYSLSTGVKMVRNFASANSECPEFKQFAFDIVTKYREAVKRCFHLQSKEAEIYMETNELNFEEICNKFSDYYRASNQDGLWLPSKNVRDSRGAPNHFANKVSVKGQRGYNLTQNSSTTSTNSTSTCHKCGKPGHWARNCPTNIGHHKSTATAHQASSTPGTKMTPWTRIPPAPGQSETKTMHGKNFHWCAKCKRWTTSHGTAQHRTKEPTGTTTSAATVRTSNVHLSATTDFAAWNCCVPCTVTKTSAMLEKFTNVLWNMIVMPLAVTFALTIVIFGVTISLPWLLTLLDILGYGTLAPVSWITSFAMFKLGLWYTQKHPVVDDSPQPPPLNRRQRRRFSKLLRNEFKSTTRPTTLGNVGFLILVA